MSDSRHFRLWSLILRTFDGGNFKLVQHMSIPSRSMRTDQSQLQWRADIQGLRALAVVMVVAFHAGLPFPGGFVGVDVFFVISGYVITAMLYREHLATGRIRFREFYLKRFKRLMPALAVMVSIVLIISALIYLPTLQQNVARTGVGAMLSVANFMISRFTGGYFDPSAEINPLLNTWSLSVEEQFYFVFPILIAFGWYLSDRFSRFRSMPFMLVICVAMFSFGLALAGSRGWSFRGSGDLLGFYSPFTRAWEFALGALLALLVVKVAIRIPKQFMSVISVTGISMVVASVWLISDKTAFPSLWTLLPVVGTLFVLFAGLGNNIISRALSTRSMVMIGDWSYSIYLWHWPFIVFAIYLWPTTPSIEILAVVLSIGPALASYYFIEQPIRRRSIRGRSQSVKMIALVFVPPLLIAGLVGGVAKYYWEPRYQSGAIASHFEVDTENQSDLAFDCDTALLSKLGINDGNSKFVCGQSKAGVPVDLALIGDSHAEHLFVGLAESFPQLNIAYFVLSATLPIQDGAEMSQILDFVSLNSDISSVVISAYWGWSEYPALDESELTASLKSLTDSGKMVFITDDVPMFPFHSDMCNYGRSPFIGGSTCSQSSDYFRSRYDDYYPVIKDAVGKVPGSYIIHSASYFCESDICSMINNDNLLYSDSNHLNIQGSRFLAEKLVADGSLLISPSSKSNR